MGTIDTEEQDNKYYTVEEFAEHFRVSRSTVWRWIRGKQPRLDRQIKVIKPGKRYLIPKGEIEKLERIAEISKE